MGMLFSEEAMQYLHERYAGHPLLTRTACSLLHKELNRLRKKRPIEITRDRLSVEEEDRDSELVFYCRHVVSELQQFYKNEYHMLELLASGQHLDFSGFAVFPEFRKHLLSYGLLMFDQHGMPRISIPAVSRYVGMELARREGRKTILKIVERKDRDLWRARRIEAVLSDLRFLEKLINGQKLTCLFGPNSFPEADEFAALRVCNEEKDFDAFINVCNRCFVEAIEKWGESIKQPRFFWNQIQTEYPSLFFALRKIKVYRHNHMHLRLNPKVDEDLVGFLRVDLEDRQPSQVDDLYFVLQQCVLDGLLTAIQIETNRLSESSSQ